VKYAQECLSICPIGKMYKQSLYGCFGMSLIAQKGLIELGGEVPVTLRPEVFGSQSLYYWPVPRQTNRLT
jgi:hypothetical protein